MSLKPSPYLLLALANVFWAGNWVVGRAIRDEIPPFTLSFWRWAIALLLILPLARPHLARDWPQLVAHGRWLLLFGFLGTAYYNALGYLGLQYTTVTNGLLLNSFIPIVIIALAWIFLGKRLRPIEVVGVVASLAGVLVIIARGDPALLADLSINAGDAWILVSVLAWALYTLLLPHRPLVNPMSFLAAIAALGLLQMLPAYAWEAASGRSWSLTGVTGLGIAYTGIFASFLGFVCWNRAVAEVGPAKSGQFMHLMPAFGILLSIVFLGERPESYHFAGIALIFTGIWLNTRRRS